MSILRTRLLGLATIAAATVAVAGSVGMVAFPANAEPSPTPCTIHSTATPTVTPRPSTSPPVTAPPSSPAASPSPTGPSCPGAISGRITDDGAGISDLPVALLPPPRIGESNAPFPAPVAQATTDAGGAFRFADIQPGQYRIRYLLPGGITQYVPRQTNPSFAGIITVTPNVETVVNESVAPHGAMAGRITTSSGAPAPQAVIGVVTPGLDVTVLADDQGRYSIPYLPAGSYEVYVGADATGAPRQWTRQHKNRDDADPVTILAGQQITVDERLLPLGRITGTLTNAGAAVSGAFVTAESQSGDAPVVARTRPDGSFTVYAYTGSYKVRFDPPGPPLLQQWASGKDSAEQADVITLVADATVELREEVLPAGTAHGLLTDWTGQPVMFASIELRDPTNDRVYYATSDADGGWLAYARPGTYKVRFSAPGQVQWAHDKLTAASADPVTIVADRTTTVDESFLRPGAMTVTAVEERTGMPVPDFCATATGLVVVLEVCTHDGTAELVGIQPGTYTVTVSDSVHVDGTTTGVTVTGGETTAVTGTLRNAAWIEIAGVDARTGEAVEGICAAMVPVDHPDLPGVDSGYCDVGGVITLPRVIPDRYNLFVSAHDGVHGSQWLGPHGGVGAQAQARVITARGGVTSRLTVRLDGRGSIAGTVTDRATGRSVPGVSVGVPGAATSSDSDGRYQLDDLGPYQWVIFFGSDDYAGQWSGGGNNRLTATPIRVRVGRTATHDTSLRKGTTLTGTVGRPDGSIPESGWVTIVNAKTLDTMGSAEVRPDGTYAVQVLGPQEVKLRYQVSYLGPTVAGWYRTAADFAHATTVSIPTSGTKRVAVVTD